MWKVGTLGGMSAGVGFEHVSGWGFNITNEEGHPVVAFVYETSGEAEKAMRFAQAMIEKALIVQPLAG